MRIWYFCSRHLYWLWGYCEFSDQLCFQACVFVCFVISTRCWETYEQMQTHRLLYECYKSWTICRGFQNFGINETGWKFKKFIVYLLTHCIKLYSKFLHNAFRKTEENNIQTGFSYQSRVVTHVWNFQLLELRWHPVRPWGCFLGQNPVGEAARARRKRPMGLFSSSALKFS